MQKIKISVIHGGQCEIGKGSFKLRSSSRCTSYCVKESTKDDMVWEAVRNELKTVAGEQLISSTQAIRNEIRVVVCM